MQAKNKSEKICQIHNERFTTSIGNEKDEFCSTCQKEQVENENKQLAAKAEQIRIKRETFDVLYKDSIVTDQTLLNATFENYVVTEQEEIANKKLAIEFYKHLLNGYSFNIVIQGSTGVGKSHLAYSILNELNNAKKGVSCLFVAIDEMYRKIRSSFRDKESKYTEEYFINLLSKVDYLVIDDLGAETGSISTDKEATDFVQRILYAVFNARQNKTTIITTNLSGKSLQTTYDAKTVSRMLKHKKFIFFKNTTDKRKISDLPF